MFRFSRNPLLIINPLSTKSSQIAIRPNLSEAKLAPTKDYRPVFVHRLNNRFDNVNDQNRFESLNLILKKMSNHVGRRQYAMQQEMTHFLEKFKAVGLDWHELQTIPSDHLAHILDKEIGMTPSQKRIFMTAVHARVCGVLVETSAGSKPRAVCLNRGLAEHGYRCDKKGHTGLCYFEGKHSRSAASIAGSALSGNFQQQIRSSSDNENGGADLGKAPSSSSIPIPIVQAEFIEEIDQQKDSSSPTSESKSSEKKDPESSSNSSATKLRVSTQPDFRIVGRLFHESHPRAWSAPTVSSFDIATIGYDFYLHPSDPRAEPQIVQAASEWEMHAEALRNVIWELLEHHAVERTHPSSPLLLPAQPFDVARGDVRSEKDVLDVLKSYYSTIDPETGIIIENVMMTDDIENSFGGKKRKHSSSSPSIVTTPWFLPSEPRPLDETTGSPFHFPLSPSIAVQCLYRAPSDVDRFYTNSSEAAIQEQQKRLVEAPYLEFRMFGHKSLCFSWPTADVRKSAVAEILEVARRVPFALPFTLYFRVDSSQIMERNNGELRKLRDERIEAKRNFFDLGLYRQVWSDPFAFIQNEKCTDDDADDKKKQQQEVEFDQKTEKDDNGAEKMTQEQQELENLVKSLNPDGWE